MLSLPFANRLTRIRATLRIAAPDEDAVVAAKGLPQRIYLVHIRKTGGTSLNHMFLSLDGNDGESVYRELTTRMRVERNGRVYVGWDKRLINRGDYFYGFSHTPIYKLALPAGTFTLTCFRDPVKRVLSHYNMLMEFVCNGIPHPCLKTEAAWLGRSFDDFVDRIPREHLLNQLAMFSPRLHVPQALDAVGRLSHYFFTEDFDQGVAELNRQTGLDLEVRHSRRTAFRKDVPESSLARLRDRLASEYLFLEQLRRPAAGFRAAA